jgi:BMFP domain-containing protein YqiC
MMKVVGRESFKLQALVVEQTRQPLTFFDPA